VDERNPITQLKMFSVEEANQLIPHLSTLIRQLQEKKNEIVRLETEIDLIELLDEETRRADLCQALENYEQLGRDFYRLIEEIHGMGCVLKDLAAGRVDFYSVYQGRTIFLCWTLGEASITSWLEIGKGDTFRRLLEPRKEPY